GVRVGHGCAVRCAGRGIGIVRALHGEAEQQREVDAAGGGGGGAKANYLSGRRQRLSADAVGDVREPPVARHANVGLEDTNRVTGVLLQTSGRFVYCVRGVAVDVHLSRTGDQHQSDRHRNEELDERESGRGQWYRSSAAICAGVQLTAPDPVQPLSAAAPLYALFGAMPARRFARMRSAISAARFTACMREIALLPECREMPNRIATPN